LSPNLTRPPGSGGGYQIGELPVDLFRHSQENKVYWGLGVSYDDTELPDKIRPYFPGGRTTFETVWNSAGLELKQYSTREQAIQAVKDWLEDHIKLEKF
jgi:hypothetical protein